MNAYDNSPAGRAAEQARRDALMTDTCPRCNQTKGPDDDVLRTRGQIKTCYPCLTDSEREALAAFL